MQSESHVDAVTGVFPLKMNHIKAIERRRIHLTFVLTVSQGLTQGGIELHLRA